MLAKEQRFIERFAAHAAKAAQVQSRVKALDKIEKIELPKKPPRRPVRLPAAAALRRSGGPIQASKAYGSRVIYDCLSMPQARRALVRHGAKRGGQVHVLKMVAGAPPPDEGPVIGASVKMGYFAQQAWMCSSRPDYRGAAEQDFPAGVGRPLRSLAGRLPVLRRRRGQEVRMLSGGEKTRLAMARMLLYPPNFLVLDEPTNHLDLFTKEMLIEALNTFEGTMLFVSHDRAFLRALGTRVLEVGGESGTDREPHHL